MSGISAGEIVVIVVLFAVLAIAIAWFVIAYQYRQTLTVFSYTKGANLDTGTVGQGTSGAGAVVMTCDVDREICVWRATAVCTGSISSESNTEGGIEPISNGLGQTGGLNGSPYGDFDPVNTVDLTSQLSKGNGQQKFIYDFEGKTLNFGGTTCPISYNQTTGSGVRPQLIATYSCIPTGSVCNSWKSPAQKKKV
jgi:hypothetical protein